MTVMNLRMKLMTLKQQCPQFAKDKAVKAGKFSYNFAPLDRIDDVLKPLCAELKLHYYWSSRTIRMESGVTNVLMCTVMDCESGDDITSEITFAGSQSDFKKVGMEFTYYSRYLLFNLLGIVTTEDSSEEEDDEEPATRKRPSRSRPPVERDDEDDDDDDDDEDDDEEDAVPARRKRPGRTGVPSRAASRRSAQ